MHLHIRSLLMIIAVVCTSVPDLIGQQSFCGIKDLVRYSHASNSEFDHRLPDEHHKIRDEILYVNTVIHVLYHTQEQRINSLDIEDLLTRANELFRAENIDSSYIHEQHKSKITDSRIQFCLTSSDPLGNSTDGVNYVYTDRDKMPVGTISNDSCIEYVKRSDLGGTEAWDTSHYFNIWIAQMDITGTSSYGVPYSNFYPFRDQDTPCNVPGVVLDANLFLDPGLPLEAPNVLVHELGHVLGLRHTWGHRIDSMSLCLVDDFIEDTPLCSFSPFCGRVQEANTCIEPTNDEVDNQTNFMNYGCQLMFTQGQVDAMRRNLVIDAPEGILMEETNCEEIVSNEVLLVDDEDDWFRISPNPSKGIFEISIRKTFSEKIELSLTDITGKVLLSDDSLIPNEMYRSHWNIGDVRSGVYFLILRTKEELVCKRLIIY